jgi:hypothetical protein
MSNSRKNENKDKTLVGYYARSSVSFAERLWSHPATKILFYVAVAVLIYTLVFKQESSEPNVIDSAVDAVTGAAASLTGAATSLTGAATGAVSSLFGSSNGYGNGNEAVLSAQLGNTDLGAIEVPGPAEIRALFNL